jgi:hypothetical protein
MMMVRVCCLQILLSRESFVSETTLGIGRLMMLIFVDLMSNDTKIGIVTAAGYTEAEKYYGRLHGLLTAVNTSTLLTEKQRQNLIIMGEFLIFFRIFPKVPTSC